VKARWLDRGVVYGLKITLCTTKEIFEAEYKRLTHRNYMPNDMAWAGGKGRACVHKFDEREGVDTCCVVCIDVATLAAQGRSGIEIVALLAHEAVHVKQELMDYIGETKPSAEFEAYTVQNIVQNLLEEYARQQPVGKKR
jgi:hypothetical protein